jgi:hypothetical protein
VSRFLQGYLGGTDLTPIFRAHIRKMLRSMVIGSRGVAEGFTRGVFVGCLAASLARVTLRVHSGRSGPVAQSNLLFKDNCHYCGRKPS